MPPEPVDSLSPIALQKATPGPIQLAFKKIQHAPQRLILGVPLAIAALVGVGFIVASGFKVAESEPVESEVSDYKALNWRTCDLGQFSSFNLLF